MQSRHLFLVLVLGFSALATLSITKLPGMQPLSPTRISTTPAVDAVADAQLRDVSNVTGSMNPVWEATAANAILRRLQIQRTPPKAWRGLGDDELDATDSSCADLARSDDLSLCVTHFLSPCRASVRCNRSSDDSLHHGALSHQEAPLTFVEARLESFLSNVTDSKFVASRLRRFHFCAAARRLQHTLQALQAIQQYCQGGDVAKEPRCGQFREVVGCMAASDCAKIPPPPPTQPNELPTSHAPRVHDLPVTQWEAISEADIDHLQRQLSLKPATTQESKDLEAAAVQIVRKNYSTDHLLALFQDRILAMRPEEDVPRNFCVSRDYPVFRIRFVGDQTAERLAAIVKSHVDVSCQACRDARVVISVDAVTDKRASYFARDTNFDIRPFGTLDAHAQSLADDPDVVVVCLGMNDARPASNSGPGISTAHLELAVHDLLRSYITLPSSPEVFVMSPIPVFDVVRLAPRRGRMFEVDTGDHSRTNGMLRYGRRAARMGTKISPTVKRVVSLLQETHRTVHLVDANRAYLRWLERTFRRLLRQAKQLDAVLSEPIDEAESPLLGLHFHDVEPMRYLLSQLPDGRNPTGDSVEYLAAVVLGQFFQRRA